MRLRFLAVILVVCGLSGAAAGWWWYRVRPKAVEAPAPEPVEFPAGAEISYPGRVRAQQVVQVPAPVEGEVQEYLAEVGDDVYEGQLLARISNQQLESARDLALEQAERAQNKVNNLETTLIAARLEESRAAADAARAREEFNRLDKVFQRQRLLYREGATPRLTYEKAEKDSAEAKSEMENLTQLSEHVTERVQSLSKDLELARKSLEEKNGELDAARQELAATEVTSPVDGVLVARRGGPGEPVNPAMPDLLQIAVDLGNLEAMVEMPPDVAQRLKAGMPAIVQLAEMGGEPLQGKIASVSGSQVAVAFFSPNPAVKPGLTAHVRIKLP